jgi:hypothetical protein
MHVLKSIFLLNRVDTLKKYASDAAFIIRSCKGRMFWETKKKTRKKQQQQQTNCQGSLFLKTASFL